MTEPILVIDLGTSTSAAAIVADERTALLGEPHTGTNVWPSSICVEDTGCIAGAPAERRKRAVPLRYIDGPRRAVDAQAAMWLGDREVTGDEALTAYVSALATEARQVYGSPIPRLVLTVPADYPVPDPRRNTMIAIGEAAGFPEVELITDAVAVALDPRAGTDLPDGALVLVCDLGASWTVAVVRVHADRPVLLAHETFPAGRELDGLLLNDLRTQGRTWLEPLLGAPGDAGLRAHYEAIDFARRLKHRLSDDDWVQDHLTPVSPPYRLTREWLEAFATPGIRSLVTRCHATVAAAGVELGDLTSVVLAGGGSRMPLAATALSDALGHRLYRTAEPEFAAVRGAAAWAARTSGRVVPADAPPWRVEPLAWQLPGGCARLLRWTVGEDQSFPVGAVVAEVRDTNELVYGLTAGQPGRLGPRRPAPGTLVGPILAVPTTRAPATLAGDPPPLRHSRETSGSWLLGADCQVLFECDPAAGAVRSYAVGDTAVVSEFRPEAQGGEAGWLGRLFVDPAGRPVLVAFEADSGISIWDVATGKVTIRLPEATGALGVLVDEGAWRLAVEAESKVSVGRYRRHSVTLWDLRTGERLAKHTDDGWRRRHPGFRERSEADGISTQAQSPDGQLQALARDGAVLVTDIATGVEVVRVTGPAGAHAGTAFGGDDGVLLASWEFGGRGRVDVWDV